MPAIFNGISCKCNRNPPISTYVSGWSSFVAIVRLFVDFWFPSHPGLDTFASLFQPAALSPAQLITRTYFTYLFRLYIY